MRLGSATRAAAVLVGVIILAGLLLAGDRGVARAEEPGIGNWTRVFECFNLREGDDPNVSVRLITDNFGGDLVRVRDLTMVCESGWKWHGPADSEPADVNPAGLPAEIEPAGGPVVMACYRIRRGSDPNDPFLLNTLNFGEDRVMVRQASMMCEQASQSFDGGRANPVPTNPRVWECFDVNGGDNPDRAKLVVTRAFGPDRVHVGPLGVMCEAAKKVRQRAGGIEETGLASGDVFACFRLRLGVNPEKPVVLNTKNFGEDRAQVRQASMLCEAARKTPLFDVPTEVVGRGEE